MGIGEGWQERSAKKRASLLSKQAVKDKQKQDKQVKKV